MSLLARNNAWIFTCESWMDQGCYIVLPVNPGEITFTMPISVTNESYRSTRIQYVWRDRGFKSLFDAPTITFTVPSGNIFPSFSETFIKNAQNVSRGLATDKDANDLVKSLTSPLPGNAEDQKDYRTGVYANVNAQASGNTPGLYRSDVPTGVQNAYAFHALAEERHIRTLPGSQTRTDNRIIAVISTLIFPRLVVYGFFSEDGIQTEESSEDPGEFDLTFSLVVTDTYPRLRYNQWQQLNDYYLNNQTTTESTLDFAQHHAKRRK